MGSNVYDFENRLVRAGGVSIVYDGDGNRVQETVAGVVTKYLTGEDNPTGYVQVLAELNGINQLVRGYEWGLELLAMRTFIPGTFSATTAYYGYDGHGSVRYLSDDSGRTTDTYDYDAFGNLIAQTGTTVNNYLFAGEQFDPALGIYYNRARYYDQRQGRFWTMDELEGNSFDPITLHKYLYANSNPVDRNDPSGYAAPFSTQEAAGVAAVNQAIEAGELETLYATVGREILAQASQSAARITVTYILQMATLAVPLALTLAPDIDLTDVDEKPERGDKHRGVIQFQGPDIKKAKPPKAAQYPELIYDGNTWSWQWNLEKPLKANYALLELSRLYDALNDTQQECRGQAFTKAQKFISEAANIGGVTAFTSREFVNNNLPKKCSSPNDDARIDILVTAGRAFVK